MKALPWVLLALCVPTPTSQSAVLYSANDIEGEPFVFLNWQPISPTPIHGGTAGWVAWCLGTTDPAYRVTQWAVADHLIALRSGRQAYGVSILDESTRTAVIVLKRPYVHHTGVISHELIHVFVARLGERDGPEWRCEISFPELLVEQPRVAEDSLRVLRAKVAAKNPSKE